MQVKPLPKLLSELSQEQQLQAAVLADKWQVPHVSSAAAKILADAASTPGVLAEAVQQHVMSTDALPDCLQPVLKGVLLSLFGDLEAVWADAGRQEQLLQLPLHKMALLLSCDELKVVSEDTVLYTASRYTGALEREEQQSRARGRLAPLIRCPHLSHFWLSGSVNSAEADGMLLAELRPQIRRLLLIRAADRDCGVYAADVREGKRLAGAPPSWGLQCRDITRAGVVELVWQLEVSKLRDAARRSVAEQLSTEVLSPPSAPLGGMEIAVKFGCNIRNGGSQVGLYFGPRNFPGDMFYKCRFGLLLEGINVEGSGTTRHIGMYTPACGSDAWDGWDDIFEVGPMAEGWDEAALAGKGMSSSGQLTVKLKVYNLTHESHMSLLAGRR